MDFPDLKDPTIAVYELTKFMVVTLLKHITELASTPVSTSLEPMPKSCLLNGSSKLDLVKVSQWEMISGLQDSCYIALLKNLVLLLHWTPNQCSNNTKFFSNAM